MRLSPLRALALVGFAWFATAATAMTVIAPTFDQLVGSADIVARGVVTDIHCITVDTPQGQAIRTLVTLHVEKALKGAPGEDITLSFLGGKVGRRTLKVIGMPEFKIGDREIVFVRNNGHSICPLIAAGHGRYRVRHDAAGNRDYIARENGLPLSSTEDIARPLDSALPAPVATPTPAMALSLESFENKIETEIRATSRKLLP